MARLVRPPEAFSQGKRKKVKVPDHLDFVRSLPCIICGANAEAAHIRMGALAYGKGETGLGQKPDDAWALPLCAYHHREGPDAQHKMNELAFWQMHGINPFVTAALVFLHSQTGNQEGALQVIINAKNQGKVL